MHMDVRKLSLEFRVSKTVFENLLNKWYFETFFEQRENPVTHIKENLNFLTQNSETLRLWIVDTLLKHRDSQF